MTTQTLSPDDTVNTTLLLIAEAGYYDAGALRAFDRLPLQQRGIVAATLLRQLPSATQSEILRRFDMIERLTLESAP